MYSIYLYLYFLVHASIRLSVLLPFNLSNFMFIRFTLQLKLSGGEVNCLDPMGKTLQIIERIRTLCGDLCDTTKKITPGDFMGTVTAKVGHHLPQCALNESVPRLTARHCSSPQSSTSQVTCHHNHGDKYHWNCRTCTHMQRRLQEE